MRPAQNRYLAVPVRHPGGARLGFVAGLVAVALGQSLAGPPAAQAVTGPSLQAIVSTHQTTAATTLTSGTLTTTQPNELLVAFLASDGPTSRPQTFSTVTGGGLTWTLRQRTNAQSGTAEVWQAVAASPVTGLTVSATRSSGSYLGAVTVAAFTGADVTRAGAVGAGSGSGGAPSAGLTTTSSAGWVWAVGDDWDAATSRTVGTGQEKVDEYLAPVGDTYWVQRRATPVAAGTPVTINDTAPTTDRWNLSLVEIPGAGSVAPGPVLSPPAVTGGGTGSATVAWTTDVASTSQVEYGLTASYGSSTTDDPSLTTTHSVALAGLSPGTTYHVRARSADAAGAVGVSADASFTTASATDTTPPTVSVTGPAPGATVSGTVTVTATAGDNVGVAGVQFRLDGAALGVEDLAAPYSASWDTTATPNGSHTLTATARDAAGNMTTSASVAVTVATDPSLVGQWGPVVPWPEVSIHAALTPAGKVLTWQGDFTQGGQQYLLDPSDGSSVQVPTAAADLFCAGQAVLDDGRILVVGGTATAGGLGIRAVTAFDPATSSWQTLAPMHYPRWYPTATTLSDGRVLVTSGSNTRSTDIVPVPEVYDPQTNTWTDLPGASRSIPYYPFVYQLPDGRVLQAGASEQATSTLALDVATQTWSTVDGRVLDGASIANYAPGKFLKVGSASDGGFSGASSATAYTLDMTSPSPSWQPAAPMANPRSFVNLTNLPDGTVLATGGSTDRSGQVDANAVKPAEIWDPATGTWRTVASLTAPRLYHSVAVLLPDGRVFVSGGGGDTGVSDQKSYQIYSPPYLFKGARPTITSAPATGRYGATATVQTPDAARIVSVSLLRTGSVTHSFDQNARALPLTYSQTAGGLSVQLPANGNLAPPGHYLLSIVDANGVPSVSTVLRLLPSTSDTTPPTAPGALSASGTVGGVDLAWTAATDNVGVTSYDIYRSATAGFTPGPATQIARVGGTTLAYADRGLAAGAYYYRVFAEDAAANLGPPSPEAVATATADTTPPSTPTGLQASATASQVSLTWMASTDNVGVIGYDVLRGGVRVAVVTGTSWSDTSVQSATAYTYAVSAHDAAGNASPASVPVTVTTAAASSGVALDRVVSTHQGTGAPSISAPALTTTAGNELLLAFVSSDGPAGAGAMSFSSVSGGGLTWRLRQRTNARPGTAEIWQAVAPTALTGAVVTATRSSGSWQGSISVAAFTGADTAADGAVATASAASGAPSISLPATRAGSTLWAAGNDWDAAVTRTLAPGQTLVDSYLSPAGDTYWVQRATGPAAAVGATLTVADTAPTTDGWDLAAVEVRPAAAATTPDTTPPVVALTVPTAGATVSGTVAVTASASDNVAVAGVQMLLDGAPLGSELTTAPFTLPWDSATAANGTHVLSARARDTSGNTTTSSPVSVAVSNTPTAGATLDASTPGPVAIANNVPTTITPAFSPPAGSVLYVALSLDAAAGSGTVLSSVSNSGVPLTWRLLGRENHSDGTSVGGDVEVWWAYNAGAQTGITVTGTYNTLTKNVPAPVGDFQVLVFNGAAADQSTAAWSPAWLISGTSSTPSATVTTTAAGSRVLGVFDSWNSSASPTPGPGQTVASLVLNPTDVDAYWVQIRTSALSSPSSTVMGATLTDTTQWHALAWEVLPLR